MVDPQTMQNFWNALIPLMIALGVYLQQRNAAKGKERGDAAARASADAAANAQSAATAATKAQEAIVEHNAAVTQKLDTVVAQTNGINTAVEEKAAKLQGQVDELKASVKKTNGGT